MREFCTLFDSNYLVKAVAMHRSLLLHCPSFHLTAFCFDERARQLIDALQMPSISTVSLDELEDFDHELLSTKDDRTSTEYCWTATPALPRYVFAHLPELSEVTYLDADLLFFSDPEVLFDEMGGASVLITPHRFSPEYAHHAVNGIYNVQFLTFRRDARGIDALEWWHDRCIEWCYYRLEDGKLGDQKYLDDWPERFPGVHVLQHKGGGLAPWNITQYDVRRVGGSVVVDDDPLVFFHYHRVALQQRGPHRWQPPGYAISPGDRALVYDPYLAACDSALVEIRSLEPDFSQGLEPAPSMLERLRAARLRAGAYALRRAPWLGKLRAAANRPLG
jgi:hypothetical protein